MDNLASKLQLTLLAARSTAALKSYEQHLKKQGDVLVELFRFSEQDGLDAEKLARKLASFGSGQVSAASVLLMLSGASSYLWLDPQHNPRTVNLCTVLQDKLPGKLKFVICPTSTQVRWEANNRQLEEIFHPFFDHNVSPWYGFDREVQSNSPICDLTCQEVQDKEQKGKKPEKGKFPAGHLLAILAMLACGLVYLLSANEKLRKDLESKEAAIQQLRKDLVAEQKAKEELQNAFDAKQACKDSDLKQIRDEELSIVPGSAVGQPDEEPVGDVYASQAEKKPSGNIATEDVTEKRWAEAFSVYAAKISGKLGRISEEVRGYHRLPHMFMDPRFKEELLMKY